MILLVLTILLSIMETVGISVIMPFISVASNPDLLEEGLYKKVYDFFAFSGWSTFLLSFGVAIILFYVVRAVYTVLYQYLLNKFSQSLYRHFALSMLEVHLHLPYRVFVLKNTGKTMQLINTESGNVSSMVLNLLQMGAEAFTVLLLYGFMVAADPKMTVVLTVLLVSAVLLILRFLVRQSKIQGAKRAEAAQGLGHILVKALGNFKFIKLKGSEQGVRSEFASAALKMSDAVVVNQTLAVMPRTILETLGFSLLIGAVMYILWHYHSASKVIPIISMYALALYRILPAINRLLGNLNTVAYNLRSLDMVCDCVNQATVQEGEEPLSFEKELRAEHLSFAYVTGGAVLKDVSVVIRKGEKVAIVGGSGGGKSTLVDLLIGIHRPCGGVISVDGEALTDGNLRSWRKRIGYIPQDIYLADGNVGENVALGETYDEDRVVEVLKMANIWEYLSTKEGTATLVGEGGIQLSGGQKQRIGIARALYGSPEVLVLDEATSALDTGTEARIMEELYQAAGGKTLIVIAHRLSTVEQCDRCIRLEHGTVVDEEAPPPSAG